MDEALHLRHDLLKLPSMARMVLAELSRMARASGWPAWAVCAMGAIETPNRAWGLAGLADHVLHAPDGRHALGLTHGRRRHGQAMGGPGCEMGGRDGPPRGDKALAHAVPRSACAHEGLRWLALAERGCDG